MERSGLFRDRDGHPGRTRDVASVSTTGTVPETPAGTWTSTRITPATEPAGPPANCTFAGWPPMLTARGCAGCGRGERQQAVHPRRVRLAFAGRQQGKGRSRGGGVRGPVQRAVLVERLSLPGSGDRP